MTSIHAEDLVRSLQQMTEARGCTRPEAEVARARMLFLMKKYGVSAPETPAPVFVAPTVNWDDVMERYYPREAFVPPPRRTWSEHFQDQWHNYVFIGGPFTFISLICFLHHLTGV